VQVRPGSKSKSDWVIEQSRQWVTDTEWTGPFRTQWPIETTTREALTHCVPGCKLMGGWEIGPCYFGYSPWSCIFWPPGGSRVIPFTSQYITILKVAYVNDCYGSDWRKQVQTSYIIMSGYVGPKKCVFSFRRNIVNDEADVMLSGRLFHSFGRRPAEAKSSFVNCHIKIRNETPA